MIAGQVSVKDILKAPNMEMDVSLRQALKVKAGKPIRLFATYGGTPAPSITWHKDEGSIPDLANVDTTESTTLLLIEKSTRSVFTGRKGFS